jgi:hypothetical protein
MGCASAGCDAGSHGVDERRPGCARLPVTPLEDSEREQELLIQLGCYVELKRGKFISSLELVRKPLVHSPAPRDPLW